MAHLRKRLALAVGAGVSGDDRLRMKELRYALAVAVLAASCARTAAAETPPVPPLEIVATFSVLADLVRNVAGDGARIKTLVGPDADVHTYEPVPHDDVALNEATLVFENGLGLEPWLDKLYASSQSRALRIVVSSGFALLRSSRDDREVDPHVWHDVTNAMLIVDAVRRALTASDPGRESTYEKNGAAYRAQLMQLDAWIRQQVATLPAARRKLVTAHDTFGYFARRYGFELIGSVLPFSTEAEDPSAWRIAELAQRVRAAQVPAVFAENMSNAKLIQRIATEAGVRIVSTLYTDALGPPGSEGDSYVKMMRFNVRTIVEALRR